MRQYVFKVTDASSSNAKAFLRYIGDLNFIKPLKTDTYAAEEGDTMSLATFKKRIRESETDAEKGNFLTADQVKNEIRKRSNGGK